MRPQRPTGDGAALGDARGLVALIHEQAVAEAAELGRDAAEAAERTLASARSEAEALREEARRQGAARGRRRAARLLAIAEAEQRRAWLVAREALIDEVMQRAHAKLLLLPTFPGAGGVVAELIRGGLAVMPPGPIRVRMPREYESLLGEAARAELVESRWSLGFDWTAPPGGGVIVATGDGELRFDNSFAARIERESGLRRRIADVLLAEEAPPFRP